MYRGGSRCGKTCAPALVNGVHILLRRLRVSPAFGLRFVVVRFIPVVVTLPVLALPIVLFDLRAPAVFAFEALALAFDGAALATGRFLVTREAGRLSTCGDVSTKPCAEAQRRRRAKSDV